MDNFENILFLFNRYKTKFEFLARNEINIIIKSWVELING